MASTSRMFNGSVLNFGGTAVTRLAGITYKVGGAKIDVTYPEDLNKLFEAGQDDIEVTCKFKGGCSLVRKATGTLSITWSDGTTSSCPGTWQVMEVGSQGDHDAAITGHANFSPTVPAAA